MFERLVKNIIEKEGKKAVMEIPVDLISVNPYQPRRHFDRGKLDELARSIKEQGVIQPVIVRRLGGGYELVAGERRLRASKLAGNKTIPAIVRRIDEQGMIEIAFIENLQREQLNEYEEAEAYSRLLRESGTCNEKVLAERIGRNEKTIRRRLWILRLPQVVKKAVVSKLISMEHAHLLAGLASESIQCEMLERIYREKLSVAAAKRIIDDMPPTLKLLDPDPYPFDPTLDDLCSFDASSRLEGCLTILREVVSAIRGVGIDVSVNAEMESGELNVTLKFPL